MHADYNYGITSLNYSRPFCTLQSRAQAWHECVCYLEATSLEIVCAHVSFCELQQTPRDAGKLVPQTLSVDRGTRGLTWHQY